MRDRSVEYPNRYRMTLVPGTTDIYEMTPVPGEVSEEGTLMSKANILDDNSEIDIWGTIGDRTPNDAFSFIGKSLLAHDKDIANLATTLEGKVVTGTYTGDNYWNRTIELGFTPKAVFLMRQSDSSHDGVAANYPGSGSTYIDNAFAVYGSPFKCYGLTVLEIVENGFYVSYSYTSDSKYYSLSNKSEVVYNYIAIA